MILLYSFFRLFGSVRFVRSFSFFSFSIFFLLLFCFPFTFHFWTSLFTTNGYRKLKTQRKMQTANEQTVSIKPGTYWRESWIRHCWTSTYTLPTKSNVLATKSTATSCRIHVVADLLPVSATVDFQQSWPRWIQLCRQCVPGSRQPKDNKIVTTRPN